MPDHLPRSPFSAFEPPRDHVPAHRPQRPSPGILFWLAMTGACFAPLAFAILVFLLWKGLV